MCNFKIGQDVVTLIDSSIRLSQFLKKNEIVTVTKMSSCEHCGVVLINVNNRPAILSDYGVIRCVCGNLIKHFGFGWTISKHFAPLQTDSEEADMTEALKEVFQREIFSV